MKTISSPPTPEPGEKKPRRHRELVLLLLALLLSFGCVFCSTWWTFLNFWPDQLTEVNLLAARQANYQGGPESIRLGVLDPSIANQAATDIARLHLTPVWTDPGTPAAIKPLPPTPTATPVNDAPPVFVQPSPTPTVQPSGPVSITNTPPVAAPTDTPAIAPPVSTATPLHPTVTQMPTSTPPATSTPLVSTATPAPPTPTLPPTPVPTNPPPPADDDDSPPPNTSPVVVSDVAGTSEDTPVIVAVLANDTDPDGNLRPGTVQVVSGPAHGTTSVDPGTGQVTYMPALNFFGTDTFSYRVCDNQGACGTTGVTVTVSPVSDPPSAVDDSFSTPEDTVLTAVILANDLDVDGDPFSVVAVSPPYTGTITLNPDSSLSYTPPLNFFGVVTLTYTIADSQALTDTATVVITVTPVNDPPVAVDDGKFTAEDTSEDIDVCANDTDVEGDPLTVLTVGPAGHGSVTVSGCLVTYQPAANYNGDDIFTYTVSDGLLTDTAQISMTVAAVNDPPVAVADSYTTPRDTILNVAPAAGVLTNDYDVDPGDTLSAVVVSGPTTGSLILNPDGSFVYTPALGFIGVDGFTYRALDSLSTPSNAVTATITVTGP